ncbi:MAG: Spy/CpxP family protein refolding chaperone [Acidocella sp.]|nr:Spy/CpxP family protein refolding chaperone [Acidocella sp.]
MKPTAFVRVAASVAALALPASFIPMAAFAQATPMSAPTSPSVTPAAPMTPMAAPAATAATTPAFSKAAAAKVDQHINTLHAQLKITATEEPAWKQFAQVMRENAIQMDAAFHSRADIATLTAPENMQSYASLAQAHADGVKKLSDAFSALYATFPEAQQKIADKLFQDHAGKPGKKKL